MRELASVQEGTRISRATSHHEEYSPKNMIDNSINTPWISDGMYPQVIVITFPSLIHIQSIDIKCANVRDILVESSAESFQATNFDEVSEKVLASKPGQVQSENITNEELKAKHLRITISSGHDLFCAIYKVSVMGTETTSGSLTGDTILSNSQGFGKSLLNNKGDEKPKSAFTFGMSPTTQSGFKFGEAFQAAKARDSFEDAQDPPDRPGVVKRDPSLSDLDENEEVEQFRISTSKKVRLSGNETPEDGQDLNELIDRDDADQEEEGEGNQVEAFHPNDGNEDDETMPDFGDRFSI